MKKEIKFHYDKLTPEQKLNEFLKLYFTAWELKLAGLKERSPQLSEEELNKKVAESFLNAKY